ncbi:hypothetical protein DCO56_26940 [Sphingobacterium athyrii]|uniref:Uncharacterized protein n=1 Tax=Sphingobacterium athyrii TaxID=2152717 RepID=A0A363NKZ6_9SPHI|nr:hypothetical protein DCO56_26940 [Sphingobacterium athyrii]
MRLVTITSYEKTNYQKQNQASRVALSVKSYNDFPIILKSVATLLYTFENTIPALLDLAINHYFLLWPKLGLGALDTFVYIDI